MGVQPYYPWDQWFDGNQHTIVRGQEFNCAVSSMIAQLYTKAKVRGIKITVKPEGNSISFARKPILFAVAQDYHLVEEWILANQETIQHEADRRDMTFGGFVEHMLDDVLDVYGNQSDFELQEDRRILVEMEAERVAPSLRAS